MGILNFGKRLILQHSGHLIRATFPRLRIRINVPCQASVALLRPLDTHRVDRLPDTAGLRTLRGNPCNRSVRLTVVGYDMSGNPSTTPAFEPRSAPLALTPRTQGKSPLMQVDRDRRDIGVEWSTWNSGRVRSQGEHVGRSGSCREDSRHLDRQY